MGFFAPHPQFTTKNAFVPTAAQYRGSVVGLESLVTGFITAAQILFAWTRPPPAGKSQHTRCYLKGSFLPLKYDGLQFAHF